jgi:voltage-gated potassium channel
MDFSIAFVLYFAHNLLLIGPLVVLLLVVILGLGILVGRVESWNRFDAIYWALITAMTVGYGDIRPIQKKSKALSIIIAFNGLVLSGITVAIALEAATKAFSDFGDESEVLRLIDTR